MKIAMATLEYSKSDSFKRNFHYWPKFLVSFKNTCRLLNFGSVYEFPHIKELKNSGDLIL